MSTPTIPNTLRQAPAPVAVKQPRLRLISQPAPLPGSTTIDEASAAAPYRKAHQDIYAATANAITIVKNYRATITVAFTAEAQAQIGPVDCAKVQAFMDASKIFLNTILPGTVQ